MFHLLIETCSSLTVFGRDIGILPELLSLSMFSKYTRRCRNDFESSHEFFLQSIIFLMSFISLASVISHITAHMITTHTNQPEVVHRGANDKSVTKLKKKPQFFYYWGITFKTKQNKIIHIRRTAVHVDNNYCRIYLWYLQMARYRPKQTTEFLLNPWPNESPGVWEG